MSRRSGLSYARLVSTVHLDAIEFPDGDDWGQLIFRIEVFLKDRKYYGLLWRLETYELNSTFANNARSSEETLILDVSTIPHINDICRDSEDELLEELLSFLLERFSTS